MSSTTIIDAEFGGAIIRRRALLPTWIKIFIWIFMLMGAMAPAAFVLGLFGMNFNLSLYGLQAFQPISLIGIFIVVLMAVKGATAFGLWTKKDWAVKLAIFDAVAGMAFVWQ